MSQRDPKPGDVIGGAPSLQPGDRIGGAHTDALRRVEWAIVAGLAGEFGKGKQSQVTRDDGFSIAVVSDGVTIVVDVRQVDHEFGW